jgi:hypothetical protein
LSNVTGARSAASARTCLGAGAPHGQQEVARPAGEVDRGDGRRKAGNPAGRATELPRGHQVEIGFFREKAPAAAAHEAAKQRLWEPVHHGEHGVEFDRKPTVRRRHEHRAPGDPAALPKQSALALECADMLDNRGGVNDIEGGVAERQGERVRLHEAHAGIERRQERGVVEPDRRHPVLVRIPRFQIVRRFVGPLGGRTDVEHRILCAGEGVGEEAREHLAALMRGDFHRQALGCGNIVLGIRRNAWHDVGMP